MRHAQCVVGIGQCRDIDQFGDAIAPAVVRLDIFATLQLLQTGDAAAMMPESVVRDHLRAGLLCCLQMMIGKNLTGFGILTREGETLSGAARDFVQALRRYARGAPTTEQRG